VPSEHSLGGLPRRGRGHQDRQQSRRRLPVEAAWHHRKPYRPTAVLRRPLGAGLPAAVAQAPASNHRLHRRWVSYAEHKKRAHRQRRGRPRAGWMVLVHGFGEWPGKRNGGNTDTAPRPTQRRTRSCCAWIGSPRSRRWTAPMLPMQPRAARTAHPRQRAARPPHSFDRSGVQGLQVGRHRVRGAGPASCRAATDQPQRLCGATTFHVARRTYPKGPRVARAPRARRHRRPTRVPDVAAYFWHLPFHRRG
jgi:hypothetical protein